MFGAQIGDDLCHLLVGERIGERRHLLSAVKNLLGHLGRSPNLVLVNIHQRGSFFGAFKGGAMAVGASLVAIENCACHLIGRGA